MYFNSFSASVLFKLNCTSIWSKLINKIKDDNTIYINEDSTNVYILI